jgi:protein TonB
MKTPPRLRLALAGSMLLHLGVLALNPPALPASTRNPLPGAITVRIEASAPAALAAKDETGPARTAPPPAPAASGVARGAPAAERPATIALPPPADTTVYTAGELDSLPNPVAPLDIGRALARARPPQPVRFELVIDEFGRVSKVAIADRAAAGPLDRELHDAIRATAFVPARKDGRAVRSRITLNVSPGD